MFNLDREAFDDALTIELRNQWWLMKRRLIEPALINGQMQPAGYEWEDNTEGPHRRTDEHSFKYHPQFVEVGETIIPFPVRSA